MYLILILFIPALSIELACNLHECPPIFVISKQQGDGTCNLSCMSPYCKFDSGGLFNNRNDIDKSDCYNDCHSNPYYACDDVYITDICLKHCNKIECGWDFGMCGYCNSLCDLYLGKKSQLGGECDPECNTVSCYYDALACSDCAEGCNSTIWGDGVCNKECHNTECNFDNGDCLNSTCAPNCYTWMIGNSICDEACNVEECNFDVYDCDCSPGCFDSLLANQVCDEVCNNQACNFDNGICGYCASGCYLDMLRNDVCDDLCNNFDCKYDFYACGCSENCKAENYGNCKSECLVGDCKYDQISTDPNKRCNDDNLILFTIYQQVILNDTNRAVTFDNCSMVSNSTCNLSMAMDPKSCYSECYFRECNYGLCDFEENNCSNIPDEASNLCNQCNGFQYCSPCQEESSFCLSFILFDFEFTYNSSYICNQNLSPEKLDYTQKCYKSGGISDFYIWHVISTQKGSFPIGDGSIYTPFETLDYALESISNLKTQTNLLYLANDGNYSLTDCEALSSDRLNFTFTTYDGTAIIIKMDGWAKFSCEISGKIKFENVIFDGSGQFATCNNSIYCEYCSYNTYNETDGFYYNDRNEAVNEEFPSSYCENDNDNTYSLFQLKNSDFELKNVEIKNWRFNYDSIIAGSGSLRLIKVNFENIRLKGAEANAVIVNSGMDIIYYGGSVRKLNNGYEFGDLMDFRGFLYSTYESTIEIKNVTFEYNLVYLKPQSYLSSASLIHLNYIKRIEIENCTFMYNYCETGLFFAELDITSYETARNETYYLTYLTFTHIYIHDSRFISNYGSRGIIHIDFIEKLLNVQLNNLVFEFNGAKTNSLVYVNSPYILDEYKTKTISRLTLSTYNTITVILMPRWCQMTNLTFNYNHAQSMITANNLANFDLTNLSINSNGSPNEDKNINTLLLDYFIKNRDIEDLYISKLLINPKAIDCAFMVSMLNPYNLDMFYLTMTNNICRSSSPTFKIYNSNITDISSTVCTDNIGNGLLPICFYFTGPFDKNITNSIFCRNKNNYISGNGAIQIESENDLYITNCSFTSNSANLSPAIYFSGKSIFIDSSNFEINESKKGSGGAIYFLSATSTNKGSAVISSSNFTNNSVYEDGGGIFIEEKSISPLSMELIINQAIFNRNYAAYGSALYIDHSVAFSEDSIITSSKFNENNSKESGTVSLYYNSGILSFKSCEFIENSSTLGAAFHIDIAQDTNKLRSKIIIESSVIRKNTGNSVIYVDNLNKNSTIETNNCTFEYNSGKVVSLNNDYFSDHGSIFQFNFASSGSCFYLQNAAILYANSKFYNNTSEKYGGVVAISFNSAFHCDYCSFIKNKVLKGKGGVLNAEQDSRFYISNSKFMQNSCENDGSTISAFNCNLTASYIYSSYFTENHANGAGLMAFISSKIIISSSIIKNNTAKGITSGIKLSLSNTEIYSSSFEAQASASGNFLYIFSLSTVNIHNTSFSKGNSSENGGAIYASLSAVLLSSSSFRQLSSKNGAAIYATFGSTIAISNCEFSSLFSQSAGGIINIKQAALSIENSIFSDFSSTGIYGVQLKKLEIADSSLINGIGINGGAVYCDSCNEVNIKYCNFANNIALLSGGAIFLTANNEIGESYNIFSSQFINNTAKNGGALFASDISLSILFSEFNLNAANTDQIAVGKKFDYGIGGGIKISCPNIEQCKLVVKSSTFTENTAKYNGGGISWDDKIPEFFNNSYIGNTAEYGNDIASYPVKLAKVNKDGSLDGYTNRMLVVSNSTLTGIASGQNNKTPLIIALVDDMDNIIVTDNLSEAELKSVNLTTQISGITKATAINGIFNFSEFVISEEPGSDIQIMVISSAIDTDKIKKSGEIFYSKNLTFNANVRECEIGEVKSGKNCEVCPEGFYSLNPNLISCLTCPNTAVCYGNYTMAPLPGYWRDNMHTDKFWKCPHPPACLGSPNKNNISYTGECGKAYKGNKCQSCKAGFSHTMNKKCEKCPSTVINSLTTVGTTLGLIFLLFIMVKTTRKSAFKPKSHTSVHIKIFLNYIQMVILASTFKLNWPIEVLELFKAQNNTDYVYQQIYSFQCLLQDGASQDLAYFRTLIIIALLPFLMVILSLLFWIFIKFIKSSYKTFWDDFISTCIILLFLIHPSTVKKMFASMNCTEINPGEYWLEEDLDIKCWNYDHFFYVLTVSLPTIILWGIVVPTICLINLIRNRDHINEIHIRLRYGFLFNGFKDDQFFWEFIILYTKIILICCSVFLTRISLKIQALIVAILYSICLRLQYSNNPYNDKSLNQMELRAKIVCVVTIYSGLYYLMGSLSYISSFIFFLFILTANLYFSIYWGYYLIKSIVLMISKKVNQRQNRSKIDSENNNLNSENCEISSVIDIEINVSNSSNESMQAQSQNLNNIESSINTANKLDVPKTN